MATPVDAKQRTMSTYNAAADFYDHPVNTFWEWYGQQTVSRLRLEAGAKILDVCCGSGASAKAHRDLHISPAGCSSVNRSSQSHAQLVGTSMDSNLG